MLSLHLLHWRSSLSLLLAMTTNAAAENQQKDQTKEDHERSQDPTANAVEEVFFLAVFDTMTIGSASNMSGAGKNQAHMIQCLSSTFCNDSLHVFNSWSHLD